MTSKNGAENSASRMSANKLPLYIPSVKSSEAAAFLLILSFKTKSFKTTWDHLLDLGGQPTFERNLFFNAATCSAKIGSADAAHSRLCITLMCFRKHCL